jgi:hypothetical protein
MSAPLPGHLVEVADLDGDGIADLVTAQAEGVGLQRGLGGGAFGPQEIVGTPGFQATVASVAVYDLDADGDLDVAFARHLPNNQPRHPEILWNDGAGTFASETLPTTALSTIGTPMIAAADLDGDGLGDLVTGPVFAVGSVHVIRRRPDNAGWLAPVEQAYFESSGFGAHVVVEPVAAADVDGDGDRDLVANRVVRNARWCGPQAGRRQQDQDGVAGTGGFAPVLGASGPFRLGAGPKLRLSGAAPNAPAVVFARWLAEAPPPGATLARATVQPLPLLLSTGGAAGVPGSGHAVAPIDVLPAMVGRTCVYRAEVLDAGAQGGWSATNELRLTFGP